MKKKTIVITAGGTIESIDAVRKIQNTSTGKLGAKIADTLDGQHNTIFYVCNRYAIRPKTPHIWIETTSVLDAEEKIKNLCLHEKIDVFIHSMAVADYTVTGIETEDGTFYSTEHLKTNKLSSVNEEIKIICKKAPKILKQLKQWQPRMYVVGFKLLQDVSREELFDVAFAQLRKNRCNLVIANDLAQIKAGNHEGLFVYPEKQFELVTGKKEIASYLQEVLEKRAFSKRTTAIQESETVHIADDVFNQMQNIGRKVDELGLLPHVEGGTYGNLSVKNPNEVGFYITGRNVNKADLSKEEVCYVRGIEVNKELIEDEENTTYGFVHYDGTVKPSIDSLIHDSIYQKLGTKAILHVHTNTLYDAPLTTDSYVCGSKEENDAIVCHMDENHRFVQMKKHGVIITDDTLENCLKQLMDREGDWKLVPMNESEVNGEPVWHEWLEHLQEVKAYGKMSRNKEEYYLVQKGNEVYGVLWLQETKQQMEFVLYSTQTVHGKGLKIGEKVIRILQRFRKPLVVRTVNACGVVNYYKKQGFTVLSDNEQFIRMQLTNERKVRSFQ